jgi:hypothetical protein
MMNSLSNRAEDTAFLLQNERTRSPVMIPGAFEKRASASAGSSSYGTGMQAKDHTSAVIVSPRERLIYEREAGGAPSERSGRRPGSILQKIWRRMRRRPDVPDGEASMKYPAGETYALGFRAVQDKAPSAAGLYAIFTSRRWLYVGESEDIRQSLFQCLNDPDTGWWAEHRPLSFAFEIAPTIAAAS